MISSGAVILLQRDGGLFPDSGLAPVFQQCVNGERGIPGQFQDHPQHRAGVPAVGGIGFAVIIFHPVVGAPFQGLGKHVQTDFRDQKVAVFQIVIPADRSAGADPCGGQLPVFVAECRVRPVGLLISQERDQRGVKDPVCRRSPEIVVRKKSERS